MTSRVGVLALQGDVPEHRAILEAVTGRGTVVDVRYPRDLDGVHALALPGGESTTLSRLLDQTGLREPLRERIRDGMGILATCAGLILVAESLEPSPHGRDPVPLGLLHAHVRRNDYGRQVDSFEAPLAIRGMWGGDFTAVFIRAPKILSVGPGVEVLGEISGSPVIVRQGSIWGLTFHPEIGEDRRLHQWFLKECGVVSSRDL